MSVLSRIEQRLGFLSVEHLPIYIVSAQALLYLWCWVNPGDAHLLLLDPVAVRYAGEYWRLLTFLFVTPLQNPLFAFFFLYLLYIYGSALENTWGSFAFTLFYLTGAIATLVAGFLFGGYNGAFYLNTTIFFAFAALHPNFELALFFILPIKIKWMALFTWILLIYEMWRSPMYGRMAILVSMLNYFLFFGKMHMEQAIEYVRFLRHKQKFKEWNQ